MNIWHVGCLFIIVIKQFRIGEKIMKHYGIWLSGIYHGLYQSNTEKEALNSLAIDAGYKSWDDTPDHNKSYEEVYITDSLAVKVKETNSFYDITSDPIDLDDLLDLNLDIIEQNKIYGWEPYKYVAKFSNGLTFFVTEKIN